MRLGRGTHLMGVFLASQTLWGEVMAGCKSSTVSYEIGNRGKNMIEFIITKNMNYRKGYLEK